MVSYITGKTRLRGGEVLTIEGGTYVTGLTTETNALDRMNVILLHNMHRNVSSGSLYSLYHHTPTGIMMRYMYRLGDRGRVAQRLRCCATIRKVAGSIPAGVNVFFIDIKILPTQPLTEMSTRTISWG